MAGLTLQRAETMIDLFITVTLGSKRNVARTGFRFWRRKTPAGMEPRISGKHNLPVLRHSDQSVLLGTNSGFSLFIANARAGGCVAMKLFFCLLGLVLVIEGLPYFAFPDRMKSWIGKIQEIPDSQLRTMGFFAMCTGLVLVYIFKS